MFRIRKIHDNVSRANREAIEQVLEILRVQFPNARKEELFKLPRQLHDPLKYRYRSILFVAEDGVGRVKGFAMMLHMPDVGFCYLELISAAPGRTGGGVGGALYERLREEALSLNVKGLFFECSVDEPHLISDPKVLDQNIARLRFYERYGARPIINNVYATPLKPGDQDLYYLVFDDLAQGVALPRDATRRVVRAILERKYGDMMPKTQIDEVVTSFRDDPLVLRPPRYSRRRKVTAPVPVSRAIALIVNEGHSIHHVRARGYVQAPVRLPVILAEIEKTGLFQRTQPRHIGEKYVKQVHDPGFVDYLRRACAQLPPGKSIYPIIFPIRNITRPPRDVELQVGYYCMDTFTPLNHNAYLAARGAVDCTVTGAEMLLEGYHYAYALVRPPGHHAERRAFGGFCYFNSAAVAAHYLSHFGRVAVLDVDFHHGNGTQDIFYSRADVLTVSIHGDPRFAYPHFSGFTDERGEGKGEGHNLNFPLPEVISSERYRRTLKKALTAIREFAPQYVVLCLGLDTAKADPTGTWALMADDFRGNGRMIGGLPMPVLIVQEGGYRTRTLGVNARHFFEGLWEGHQHRAASKPVGKTFKQSKK
jgi:acetoin utilization deacetylase AcuC-like enzyme/GNAT superfamily N-acetyltransferase